MINSLEFRHIASYLSFDLKARCDKEGYIQRPDERIGSINYWHKEGAEISIFNESGYFLCSVEECKPILRPLSDLVRPLKYKDEEFIPIEKLLDTSFGINWSASDYLETGSGLGEYWTQIKDGGNTFGYNDRCGWFYVIHDGVFSRCERQLDMFQKLFEWHFDVFGLIDSRLAIDMHTLKDQI